MAGKAYFIDRKFEKQTICFNCGIDASRKIEMLPVKTTVTCAHCGTKRVYDIHGANVAAPIDARPVHKHKYDTWHFNREAVYPNYGGIARHAVIVNEFVATILCPVCNFQHLYWFALYDRVRPC